MCGICGTISLDDGAPDPSNVGPMLAAMRHRGPDADGSFASGRVAAGIRRLKVIDLETGDQPIANEDGSVRVVFNGEIYNYRALREELQARGHRFRTRSDTEVLVHLWEDDGPAMLSRLNGMFALCVHDQRRDEVLVARDRLGIKPLYLALEPGRIVFASEIAALVRHGGVRARLEQDRLVDLFLMQYVPGDATLYEGIRKLPPGHLLHVRGGDASIESWYDLPTPGVDDEGESVADWNAELCELRRLLGRAVRDRTVADVPLGMFLSGGIDSSIIVTLLAESTAEPPRTYSVGFEDEPDDGELRFARLAAERNGTRHNELRVGARDVERALPALIDHAAEPILDPATIPTWLLSELARREVTVVLTGEGADELFGGYRRYLLQSRYRGLARLPGLRAAAALPVVERLLPTRAGQALAALAEDDPARNHLLWTATVDMETAARLFEPEALGGFEARVRSQFESYFDGSSLTLNALLRADVREWLPHNLLLKVDRSSMAHSLEARVPFLDHHVVERAARMPADFKIRGGETKRVLREAFRERIPPEIVSRPKRGFDLPLGAWLRGPLRELAGDTVTAANLKRWGSLRPGGALSMLDDHLEGRRDHALPLFGLISTLLFLERRA